MFKKGKKVVKVITGAGVETASLTKIVSVKGDVMRCEGDDYLTYSKSTGREINPVIPGFSSRLICMEE